MPQDQDLITLSRASREYGIKIKTVRKWRDRGQLAAVKRTSPETGVEQYYVKRADFLACKAKMDARQSNDVAR